MKKFIFILAALLFVTAVYAEDFSRQVANKILPVSNKYLMRTYGFRPSAALPQEPSLWDDFISLFTSEREEAKQKSLAQYIYNMYIVDAAKGGQTPQYLTTEYTGVLDPLYRSSFKNAADIESFFKDNKAEIQALLKEYFQRNLHLTYNPKDKNNEYTLNRYIKILKDTYNRNKKLSYMYGAGAINNTRLSENRNTQLAAMIKDNNIRNKNLAVIYQNTDLSAMLDNATRTGAHTSSKTHTYRPLKEECSACSYTFCKDVCTAAQNKYGQYKILRVYQLYAYPKTKYLKDNQGKSRFKKPEGGTYPAWDYHSASLLVFEENAGLSFTVTDNFLLKEPVSFQDWINLFDKNTTFFTVVPFIRNENTENSIKKFTEVPSSYKPHPVRK